MDFKDVKVQSNRQPIDFKHYFVILKTPPKGAECKL